jgi:hypothetical protein
MDDNNSSSSSFSLKTIASKFLPTPSESVEEVEPEEKPWFSSATLSEKTKFSSDNEPSNLESKDSKSGMLLSSLGKAQPDNEPDISSISLSLEDIFINLTLLSKIEVGDKLIQNGSMKHINIDTSYFQFITRWFKGSNRNNSLKFINHVLNRAFEYNDNMLEEKTEKSAVTVFRLTADLKNSLNGLNNLKQTYSTDKLIQSELDVMIDNVRNKLDLNSKNLNFTNNPSVHFLP